ncbi:MAG: hypothetical protein GF401_10880 [Chitinivibrionales bacterium]|nr:hypothetical protein [Chitinivibrionales bacterium]
MNATSATHKHSYNPIGPVAYFITFRCYGTWLHGDKRGSMDRISHNKPGIPLLPSSHARQRQERKQMKHPPVLFTPQQRLVVDRTIRSVVEYNRWLLHALRVMQDHVHVILTAGKNPELVMNSLKSWCTRRLREGGFIEETTKPWSRHGSTRYLWNEDELKKACLYVNEGHKENNR